MSDESGFSMDEAGNVVIAISAARWAKVLKHAGTAMHLDVCAHAAYKEDRYTAAASFWRDSSNWALGRLANMVGPELMAILDEAKANSNEPGK